MPDFSGTIEVGYNTDLWGPYSFLHSIATSATANDGVIPFEDTISAVSVEAYIGKVTRKSTLSEFTDISTDLIDPSYTPTVSGGDTIKVKFQYPGVAYKGEKATVIFKVTLASGGTKSFYFHYVRIR